LVSSNDAAEFSAGTGADSAAKTDPALVVAHTAMARAISRFKYMREKPFSSEK
jgi:hypothetical protein